MKNVILERQLLEAENNKWLIRVQPKAVYKAKPHKKPKASPKAVEHKEKHKISLIEKKRRLIERRLEEIQKKADEYKFSLQCIDGQTSKSKGNQNIE